MVMYVLKRIFTRLLLYLFHVCKYLKKKTDFQGFSTKNNKIMNIYNRGYMQLKSSELFPAAQW